jgi:hemoglobin
LSAFDRARSLLGRRRAGAVQPAAPPGPPAPPPVADPTRLAVLSVEHVVEQWVDEPLAQDGGPRWIERPDGTVRRRSVAAWQPVAAYVDADQAALHYAAVIGAGGNVRQWRVRTGHPLSAAPANDEQWLVSTPPDQERQPMPAAQPAPDQEGQPTPAAAQPAPDPSSLFVAIGGYDTLRAAVKAFYRRVVSDRELEQRFRGVDMANLCQHQVRVLDALTGGPGSQRWPSLEALHAEIAARHAGMGITPAEWDRVAVHLYAALTIDCLMHDEQHVEAIMRAFSAFRTNVVAVPAPPMSASWPPPGTP